MPTPFREGIRDLQAEYPFGVVLRRSDDPVILIPASASRSTYDDVRIEEPTRIRQMLAAAASDSAVLCSLRRIFEISMPGLAPSRLSDSQILDATANAVTDGRLYAVVSKDDQSMVKMQNKPVRSSNIDY